MMQSNRESTSKTTTPPNIVDEYLRLEANLTSRNVPDATMQTIGHLLITGRDALAELDPNHDAWNDLIVHAADISDTGEVDEIVLGLETYLSNNGIKIPEQIAD